MAVNNFGFSVNTIIADFARNCIDSLVRLTNSDQKASQTTFKKQLLIIRFDAIGDFVLFTGILPAIRELYPNQEWEITILASKECKSLAEFVRSGVISFEPIFDSFIPIDRLAFSRNLIYRFKFQKFLQSFSYDTVLHPVFSRYAQGDQLVFISNANEKIGIDGDCVNITWQRKQKNNSNYTKLIPSESGWLLEITRNVSFIKGLGIDKLIDGIPRWKMPSTIVDESMKLATSHGIGTPFAVVCPGASATCRIWPAQKISSVIDYLWNEYRMPVLICGTQADKIISVKIQKNLKGAKVACLCGSTNLAQLSALISSAKLCVSMDSSPAHLAVAVNTPVVCVIGGGFYKRFFPYGNPKLFRAATEELDCFYCDWKCKFSTPFCVRDISVSTVIKEVDFLIKNETYSTTV
jgi:ADP-heptose:LPS heptosyltransferase